ncbi:hypothetical protein Ciccas_002456 [Cichlidogyrus casuarinus]|uniref:Inorganic phosphate cotransporter n=1 Tax=Cichlidogyrus casuarinus TaxID=1844966 RepID=A0ABD2QH51_9PLAT
MGFLSFAASGYSVNIVDIAPQYAGTIFGISNTFATIPGFISPLIVAEIIGETPTLNSWLKVFGLGAALAWLGAFVYFFGASAEQQSWAIPQDSEIEEKSLKNEEYEIQGVDNQTYSHSD